jgi:hypothetical protein
VLFGFSPNISLVRSSGAPLDDDPEGESYQAKMSRWILASCSAVADNMFWATMAASWIARGPIDHFSHWLMKGGHRGRGFMCGFIMSGLRFSPGGPADEIPTFRMFEFASSVHSLPRCQHFLVTPFADLDYPFPGCFKSAAGVCWLSKDCLDIIAHGCRRFHRLFPARLEWRRAWKVAVVPSRVV